MPPKKDAGKAAPKKPKVRIFNIDSAEKLKASDRTNFKRVQMKHKASERLLIKQKAVDSLILLIL